MKPLFAAIIFGIALTSGTATAQPTSVSPADLIVTSAIPDYHDSVITAYGYSGGKKTLNLVMCSWPESYIV